MDPFNTTLNQLYYTIIKKDYFKLINNRFEQPSNNILKPNFQNLKLTELEKLKIDTIKNLKSINTGNKIFVIKTFINKIIIIIRKKYLKDIYKLGIILKRVINSYIKYNKVIINSNISCSPKYKNIYIFFNKVWIKTINEFTFN